MWLRKTVRPEDHHTNPEELIHLDTKENKVGTGGTVFDTGRLKELGKEIVASPALEDWVTATLDDFESSGDATPAQLALEIRDHAFEALQALGTEQWEAIAVDMIADRPSGSARSGARSDERQTA